METKEQRREMEINEGDFVFHGDKLYRVAAVGGDGFCSGNASVRSGKLIDFFLHESCLEKATPKEITKWFTWHTAEVVARAYEFGSGEVVVLMYGKLTGLRYQQIIPRGALHPDIRVMPEIWRAAVYGDERPAPEVEDGQ